MKKVIEFVKKRKVIFLGTTMAATNLLHSFATPNTGNTDLDTIIGSMEVGTESMKAGGLYIVGIVIVVAVVFFGARWLWNMWRGWMSRSQ